LEQHHQNKKNIMTMSPFNSIPNLLGYLVIAEDGAVIASNGELENDEKTSEVIYRLVTMSHR
jgi:ragulator complex protein LAMTOR4